MRLVLDCNFLCYRSLHTLENLAFEERKVGVVFGFIKQMISLAEKFKTNQFIFCWDSRQSYRKLISPTYKGNRQRHFSPEEQETYDLGYAQFDELRQEVLPYLGFRNIFHQTGYEADDLIAWVVWRFPDDTVIVSSDSDLFQLLHNDRFNSIKIWNFKTINDEGRFSKDWFGLKPKKWVEVKSIAGCNSDNVAGVPGVGEITAAKYVAGLIDSGKKVEDIRKSKTLIDENRDLVALPFPGRKKINITEIYEDEISPDKFQVTFGQYGFRSLLYEDRMAKWKKAFFGG